MAKHEVKCPYCNIIFDTNKEEFVQLNRRYAHKTCYDAAGGEAPPKQTKAKKTEKPEDPELTALKDYIYSLFGDGTNWAMVMKQIKKYQTENNYTLSGIRKSLMYFYEVEHGEKDKANGAIGIVPFTYQKAFDYYYSIYLANSQNENKVVVDTTREYVIKPPKKKGVLNKLLNWGIDDEE